MKKFCAGFLSLFLIFFSILPIFAAEPAGYYDNAKGKNKKDLLLALCGIVGTHTAVGYNGLWTVYKDSDLRPDGTIWDMYSTAKFTPGTNQCGSYKNVGDCYNREHSIPQSWFNEASPMKSDAFHVYPTDGKVNGQRSDYPYGECANGKTLPANGNVKALGKLGTCTFPGYTGTVFEPIDEYKGDFARTYFYMAAAYNDRIDSWTSDAALGKNRYPCYTEWTVNLLMKWHRQDPVSEKEINRNEAVYKHQKNRNPFIDHPEMAEYVWGNKKNEGWAPGSSVVIPTLISPAEGKIFDLGTTPINKKTSIQIEVKGSNLTENVTITNSNSLFTVSQTSLTKDAVNSANGAVITVSFISTKVGDYASSITLSSKELGNRKIEVKAKTVDGIPALSATDITTSGFTAHWTNISEPNAKYTLNLYKNGVKEQTLTVNASDGKYTFTGLQHSTKYSYDLTYNSLKSNKVEVTTTTPVPELSLIFGEGSLNFQALPGKVSAPVEVKVYTENITDEITAKVTGSFEISFDKTNWSNSLTIDKSGENFFIRSKAIETEGTYTGTISLSTPTVKGSTADLSVVVAVPRSFIEDWETGKTGGYWDNVVVTGNACKWKFLNAGIWGDPDRHGKASCRFGSNKSSSIEMNEDKPNGAGVFSFYSSIWNNDNEASVNVEYSTDLGQTWNLLQAVNITTKNLAKTSIKVEKGGNIRFRIDRITGKRINIDDIEISDFIPSGGESITALPATDVTSSSFTAHWTNISEPNAKYTLNLYNKGVKEKTLTVNAVDEKYTFTGLQASTEYAYDLSYGNLKSNKIDVMTSGLNQLINLIYTSESLKFKVIPGAYAAPAEIKVQVENISDEITAEVDNNSPFEISHDRTNWKSSLIIDNSGETFYIRPKVQAEEGAYTGTLTVSSPSEKGQTVNLRADIEAPHSFFEDFEKSIKGNYDNGNYQGSACLWDIKDAGIWKNETNRHGNNSCRLGNSTSSSITMLEDKINGADTFSFYAALWSKDANADISIEYSMDQGTKWEKLQDITISNTKLTKYSFVVRKNENIRFRLMQTTGRRVNFDDIVISDYTPTSTETVKCTEWDILPAVNGVNITAEEGAHVIIYNLNAIQVHEETISVKPTFIPLEKGIYIVTLDNERGKKIIVK